MTWHYIGIYAHIHIMMHAICILIFCPSMFHIWKRPPGLENPDCTKHRWSQWWLVNLRKEHKLPHGVSWRLPDIPVIQQRGVVRWLKATIQQSRLNKWIYICICICIIMYNTTWLYMYLMYIHVWNIFACFLKSIFFNLLTYLFTCLLTCWHTYCLLLFTVFITYVHMYVCMYIYILVCIYVYIMCIYI